MEIKFDKALLEKISTMAKIKYIENGNFDGVQYLSPAEITARAYAEATLSVLVSKGYSLTKLSKD